MDSGAARRRHEKEAEMLTSVPAGRYTTLSQSMARGGSKTSSKPSTIENF
jgi:hypothetical protein